MEVKASQFLVLAFEVQTSENMRFTVFFTFALFFNLFFFTKTLMKNQMIHLWNV